MPRRRPTPPPSPPRPRAPPRAPAPSATSIPTPQPDKVKTTDLALELAVDFASKQIGGSATYTLDWLDPAATQLVLDTRELTIEKVVGERSDGKWEDLKYALAPADKTLGSKLTIETPQRNKRVRVTYKTAPTASGLQWLTPSMTEGKKTPFMFSQSQQIHARSWVPLQDTPRVRFTYTAHVTAPKDAMVLMSADNDPKAARDGDYTLQDAAEDPVVPARDRGRRPGVPADQRARRRVGGADDGDRRPRPSSPTPKR